VWTELFNFCGGIELTSYVYKILWLLMKEDNTSTFQVFQKKLLRYIDGSKRI
jgi:hypothetical protein